MFVQDCTDVVVLITISPKIIPASYPGQLMFVVSLYSCSVRFRAGERLRPPTIRNGREAVPGQLHQQIKSEISINNDTGYPLKSCTNTSAKGDIITSFFCRGSCDLLPGSDAQRTGARLTRIARC